MQAPEVYDWQGFDFGKGWSYNRKGMLPTGLPLLLWILKILQKFEYRKPGRGKGAL